MGNRSNIVVQFNKAAVYLYSHWRGRDVAISLRNALADGRESWDDDSYLTRIIFDRVCDETGGTKGFGIAPCPQDNEHPVPVVDPSTQQVRVYRSGDYGYLPLILAGAQEAKPLAVYSFEAFAKFSDDEALRAMTATD